METLTRLVSESLARHGFDRPVDYRRLQWSRWFRCESHHSLLLVPSKPGVFALAEEIMDLGATEKSAQDLLAFTAEETDAKSRKPEVESTRRMLAVSQFFEDEDMAFVLDRMLSHQNPMGSRLTSGRYFIRYVVIEDGSQRRSICNALNQWVLSSAEKATGIGSHFATSLELTPAPPNVGRTWPDCASSSDIARLNEAGGPHSSPTLREVKISASDAARNPKQSDDVTPATAPRLNSAVPTTIHCSSSFPSGF